MPLQFEPAEFCLVSSNYFFLCCQWVWEWRSLPSFCHFCNSFQAAGIYFNKVHFNGAWSHNTWGCDLRRAHKLSGVSSGGCMQRRPPRTPCVLLRLCQGCSDCQAVPAQEAVSFGMLSLAAAKRFRGRYTIPALGELFWTDLQILLDPCGMQLQVCCPMCAGHWGHRALAPGTMPGPFADSHTEGAPSCRLLCHQPHPKLLCLPWGWVHHRGVLTLWGKEPTWTYPLQFPPWSWTASMCS